MTDLAALEYHERRLYALRRLLHAIELYVDIKRRHRRWLA